MVWSLLKKKIKNSYNIKCASAPGFSQHWSNNMKILEKLNRYIRIYDNLNKFFLKVVLSEVSYTACLSSLEWDSLVLSTYRKTEISQGDQHP